MPEITQADVMNAVSIALPSPPISKETTADIDIYVDSINGDDSNDGTQANPIKTLDEADARIPHVVNHAINIHLRAQNYVVGNRGFFLTGRLLNNGFIAVMADEDWDPNVYNVIATGTAQAGSTYASLKHGKTLTTNEWRGYTLEFTSGANAGLRRTIAWNDSTDVDPGEWLFSNPAAGDTYRVFEATGCSITGDPTAETYSLSKNMLGGHPIYPPDDYRLPKDVLSGVIVWDGIVFETNGSSPVLGAGDHILYGNRNNNGIVFLSPFTRIWSGFGAGYFGFGFDSGISRYQLWWGWGHASVSNGGFNVVADSQFTGIITKRATSGYLQMNGNAPCFMWFTAGTLNRFAGFNDKGDGSFKMRMSNGPFNTSNPPRADFSGVFFIQIPTSSKDVLLMFKSIRAENFNTPIIVRSGSRLVIEGSNTIKRSDSGTVIDCQRGGEILLNGSPAGIGAGGGNTDWDVDGVSYDPLAALPSAGSVITGTQTSKIIRTS